MLYLVGLGLGSEKDITLRGLEAIKSSSLVILESYTSLLGSIDWSEVSYSTSMLESYSLPVFESQNGFKKALDRLSKLYGKPIHIASRWEIESADGEGGFLHLAKSKDVALLIVGDPLYATTHADLILRCKRLNISYQVIHNASIMNAVGSSGISLYSFGPSISIPFFTKSWKPYSFYEKLEDNLVRHQQHSLLLLDIKVKEPTETELARGRYENPQFLLAPSFMNIRTAIEQLFEAESVFKKEIITNTTLGIGIARAGHTTEFIGSGTLQELYNHGENWGPPLHVLIIPCPSKLHDIEKELISSFQINS